MASDGANLLFRLRFAPWAGATATPDARRSNVLRFWFYVGVPLLLGFVLGWVGAGRTAGWPVAISLIYWIGLSLVATWAQDLATRPVAALLRPRGAPLWFVLIVGQLLAGYVLVSPFVGAFLGALAEWLPAGTSLGTEATPLASFAKRLPSNVTLWVGLNLLFFHALKMPRFGYVPRPADVTVASGGDANGGGADAGRATGSGTAAVDAIAPADAAQVSAAAGRIVAPAFLARVRTERRGTRVLALRAEGHYLRVYTDAGSDLVLCRLSDAIAEMSGEPGAQVHRSWWVAERALATERHGDRLRLVNGVDVPVSRSYRVAARQRGWLEG